VASLAGCQSARPTGTARAGPPSQSRCQCAAAGRYCGRHSAGGALSRCHCHRRLNMIAAGANSDLETSLRVEVRVTGNREPAACQAQLQRQRPMMESET
jgi:hypothetical protein